MGRPAHDVRRSPFRFTHAPHAHDRGARAARPENRRAAGNRARPDLGLRPGDPVQRLGPEHEHGAAHRGAAGSGRGRDVAAGARQSQLPAPLRALAVRRRLPAAADRGSDRPHRHGRATLARPGTVPLSALRAHEAVGTDDVRLVPARAPAAAGLGVTRDARRADSRAGAAGALVIILAGLRGRVILALLGLAAAAAWFGWSFMHDYQRKRVLTFLNPQTDPLGAGYHIIQSQIAIGSGGVFGKGWMNGSQAQLEFLPERSTDFVFAVVGEEFGLLGLLLLLLLYLFVVARSIYLATQTQDTYARLLAGSIALTFFVYVLINAGMVTGLLPVVGVPLPLVSYGGSSVVTLLAGFGIVMGLYSHRKLVGS